MKKLSGVVTPMVTPFLDNEEIDFQVLKRLTSWLIDTGVNGLYPCGTTGEGPLLTMAERKAVAEAVIEAADSRVPVFVQTGAISLRDSVELSLHAYESGADGVGVVTPSYYYLSQEEIQGYYIDLARALPQDFSIYMYSIPSNAINDIEPETAAAIAEECPNVLGIKYSGDNFVQLQAYCEIRGGTFSVLAGNDRTLASVMSAGCDGTVSGLSNVFPEKVTAVYTAYVQGKTQQSVAAQREVYQSSRCLFDAYFLAGLKAGMVLRGMPVGKLRKPLPKLTASQWENLKNQWSENEI